MIIRWYLYNREKLEKIMEYVNNQWAIPREKDAQSAAKRYIENHKPTAYKKKALLID
jgi:hypothetical protein